MEGVLAHSRKRHRANAVDGVSSDALSEHAFSDGLAEHAINEGIRVNLMPHP